MTRGLRYATVTFLLLAAMAGLIGARIYTLESGFEIRLRTFPMNIEPLILGEDVNFEYEIAQLNLTTLPGDNLFEVYNTVYVKLGQLPGGVWVAKSTHKLPPTDVRRSEIVLKGEVVALERLENIPPPVLVTKEITVRYGIERYVVPRGVFERPSIFGSLTRPVTVHAAVNPQGRAVITGLRLNNEFYAEPVL